MTTEPVTMKEVMQVFDCPPSWATVELDQANNREYLNLVRYLVARE